MEETAGEKPTEVRKRAKKSKPLPPLTPQVEETQQEPPAQQPSGIPALNNLNWWQASFCIGFGSAMCMVFQQLMDRT